MKIIVSDIPEDGMNIEINDPLKSEAVCITSPVRAQLHIIKTGSDIILTGEVSADLELCCSRCLKNFASSLNSRIEVSYHPSSGTARDDHRQLRDDELETGYYIDDELDTDDVLVEQLLLNVPMKPLCSQNCEGICPVCGSDRNENRCSCSTKEPDPRLRQLEQLLKKKEQ
ncbi:MAG: DUF177 domain-containing protein [Dissulfurispiraceae bacterium]|jgi:uncharacterized protein|nr:DUF177 domain-containing protein [Dissulfurispiraceae bacterium]